LPDNLLKNTAIPTSILVLSKKKNDKINMIDASRIYEKGKRKKILNNENISEILDIYEKRQFEVKLDEIIENDHLLLPKRYANNIEFENAVKIEDVAKKIFRGVQISSKELDDMQTTDDNFQYEILNVGDIGKYKIDYDNLLKINSLEGKYDRYLLKNKDFIMTIRGTKFKTAVVEIENDRKIIATGNIMVIRPDTKKINPYYLKIFLDSKIGQKLLYSIETGSIMISISMKTLENTEIPNIGIYKQKNIEEKFLAYQDELEYYKKKERDIQNKIKDIFEDEVGGF
jgi:type I restriction enzyme M protein